LRGCDLVKLKIGDALSGGQVRNRATVVQQKTGIEKTVRYLTADVDDALTLSERTDI